MMDEFFSYKQAELHTEDISVTKLAEIYGSPLYIYSANSIRKQFQTFEQALNKACSKPPLIAYACKANDRLGILKLMNELGAGIDVVSCGEMKRALAAGIPADKIIFSGTGKTETDLKEAIETGIQQINVESEPELRLLSTVATSLNKKPKILFRLNPDVEAGTHDKISTGRSEDKFGISAERIKKLYKIANDDPHLNPTGISIHIGSQVADPRYFIPAFEKIVALVTELRADGLTVTDLDLGGGLGITYRDEPVADVEAYAQLIKDMIEPLGCHLGFEPGRYLVGNAGILLTKIIYVKETAIKTHIIVDSAMNDLIRPALYEAYHTIKPVIEDENRIVKAVDIVGPVCESGDTFAKDRPIALPVEGEMLAIFSAGAYSSTMASYYNARVPATEILVDGEQHKLINQPQSIEDQIKTELDILS